MYNASYIMVAFTLVQCACTCMYMYIYIVLLMISILSQYQSIKVTSRLLCVEKTPPVGVLKHVRP